jgi:hypothetical protein
VRNVADKRPEQPPVSVEQEGDVLGERVIRAKQRLGAEWVGADEFVHHLDAGLLVRLRRVHQASAHGMKE